MPLKYFILEIRMFKKKHITQPVGVASKSPLPSKVSIMNWIYVFKLNLSWQTWSALLIWLKKHCFPNMIQAYRVTVLKLDANQILISKLFERIEQKLLLLAGRNGPEQADWCEDFRVIILMLCIKTDILVEFGQLWMQQEGFWSSLFTNFVWILY